MMKNSELILRAETTADRVEVEMRRRDGRGRRVGAAGRRMGTAAPLPHLREMIDSIPIK